jgi:hypothetical protein
MTFIASDISAQGRYKITQLVNGVDPGDSVAMRQLTPIISDIQGVVSAVAERVKSADFATMFNQLRTSNNLQDSSQVDAAIAAALMGLPDPESRLASQAVHSVFVGTLAQLTAGLSNFPLVASDSGNIDDANTSCILLDSEVTGETGLYQLRSNGSLMSLNAALFQANLGYYSRFYVINGDNPGREFAVTELDTVAGNLSIAEVPYVDEYVGIDGVVVNNVNKTVRLNFSAADFVLNQGLFELHPAIKTAIASIPALESSLEALGDLLDSLNTTLSAQITALVGQVDALTQTVTGQGNSISGLQTAIQALTEKFASSLVNVQKIFFSAGSPKIQTATGWVPAPSSLVTELSGNADVGNFRITHNRGLMSVPQYFEANSAGEAIQPCFAYATQSVNENFIEMRIEKYKGVLIVFEAGLTAYAFSDVTL